MHAVLSVHTVSHICNEAKKLRQHIGFQGRIVLYRNVTSVGVLYGAVFEFYDEGNFPTAKNLTQETELAVGAFWHQCFSY
jgi:hypothetical protein